MVIKKRRDNKLFRLLVVYTLIFSVGLNIALLCFFFFFLKQDRTYIQKSYPKKSSDFRPILVFKGSQIQDVSRYSFKQLKQSLSNKRLLEFGYTYREIALGFLNTHYHIDIQRVLGPSNLSFYPITFINKRGKKEDLLLLVGLSDVDYEKIATFMEKEKWPLTSKGQFLLLKEMKKQI